MKKNILIIDREWDETIHHDAVIDPETGEIITPAWDEVVHRKSMKSVTIDMTPEEEAEIARQQAEEEARRRQEPPTWQETVEAQVTYTAMMTDTMLEG